MEADERTTQEIIAETGTLSRGGYHDEEDYAECRKRSQRVRGDFLAPTYKAKATFSYESITFNMTCVGIFPDDQFVSLDVDVAGQRVVVETCEQGDNFSLKFANRKDGRNVPRKCLARHFCQMIFEMMGWHTQARYRTLAIEQKFFGKKKIIFNLDECLQVFTETLEEADDKKKRMTIINMPADWKGRFGYTLEELEAKRKVEESSELVRIDNKTGERRSAYIEPKLPTPEELMHRPYGGIRPRMEDEGIDE